MADYTDKDLQSCVDAGILTGQQYWDVKAHVRRRNESVTIRREVEYFRLISGFNDVFVVVGCALVLAAIGSLFSHVTSINASLGVAIGGWVLAEYFVRQRRMALPAFALAITFCGACLVFLIQSLGVEKLALVSLLAAAIQALFWWRFRVPVTIAVSVGCIVFTVQLLIAGQVHGVLVTIPFLQLTLGFAVFAFAMWWDLNDLERQGYRADVAFWLHILAAPLIVSGVFSFVLMYGYDSLAFRHAVGVTLIYAVLALISLWVDRRALMLSAMSVLVFTYNKVLNEFGVISLGFAIAGLVVGVGLLVLSVYWSRCRIAALKLLPARLHRWVGAQKS
ncbi:hypothetical protein J7J47_05400 [Halomonas sp. ISL-60]|uniref:hypothetical protein n=1 Tax=Halomonas sp. ISL-56 TaxID=2819149 RepID=UPI001BEA40E8|nr:hypothetical protein [Halomonas sp. ISL-56]MBT2771672.1 hypothetical protein [Halomonas sp. ISL-60]MBT2803163.1 hypothetical protein [Halomonas sp. ISL-56]